MVRSIPTGALLVLALGLNLGWLWPPLGLAALTLASYALVRDTRDRVSRTARGLILTAAWTPYLFLVLASGVAVGVAGTPLFSAGGSVDSGILRALVGLIVALLAAVILFVEGGTWVRRLAAVSVAAWLLLAPSAVWIGSGLGTDPGDPWYGEPASSWAVVALVSPFVIAYALILLAAALRWDRRSPVEDAEHRGRRPSG